MCLDSATDFLPCGSHVMFPFRVQMSSPQVWVRVDAAAGATTNSVKARFTDHPFRATGGLCLTGTSFVAVAEDFPFALRWIRF